MRRLITILTLSAALTAALSAQSAGVCSDSRFAPSSPSDWNGWAGSISNDRFQDAPEMPAARVPQLQLKWAFGFPEARSVMGEPSVSGGRVFIGVDTGDVYSLDQETGCLYWSFKADASVRTAITIGPAGDLDRAAFFGDLRGQAYAVDATTGDLIWKATAGEHPSARITGAPQLYDGRLYVPVASGEEGAGSSPTYECCTFRGNVVALDAATGDRIWKTYVIRDEPRQTGTSQNGTGRFGPSGAGIWSAPTIDPERGLLYVGTGDAYSAPADPATDALVAMDLETGEIRWVAQETAGDIWLSSCMRPGAPDDCGPDHDFGSPPILKTLPDGRDILVAGQKSGNVWAHDPDTGEMLWRTPLVANTTEFGGKIIWGGAADATKGYFGIGPGGIGAVQLAGGELQWFTQLAPAAGLERYAGQDGPIAAIPGVIFSDGWDGVVRALASDDGHVIWEYNTVRDFDTVNGVAAKGGSMGAAGPVVANGMLLVPSGYVGVRGGMTGNVLLAFSVE